MFPTWVVVPAITVILGGVAADILQLLLLGRKVKKFEEKNQENMFLRIKKKKSINGKTGYSFMLVENNIVNGKVKQKVVKNLTSYTEHSNINEYREAILRISVWKDIYENLILGAINYKKIKEIIDKIKEIVPIPVKEDIELYVKHKKSYQSTEKHFREEINLMIKELNDYWCSAYRHDN